MKQARATALGTWVAWTVRPSGVIAAGFEHQTSRAGDPQLHTHVLLINLA
ncbi:MAG: hypothetical protein NVS3B26_15070 [Mycobacteriales bacterium]